MLKTACSHVCRHVAGANVSDRETRLEGLLASLSRGIVQRLDMVPHSAKSRELLGMRELQLQPRWSTGFRVWLPRRTTPQGVACRCATRLRVPVHIPYSSISNHTYGGGK